MTTIYVQNINNQMSQFEWNQFYLRVNQLTDNGGVDAFFSPSSDMWQWVTIVFYMDNDCILYG